LPTSNGVRVAQAAIEKGLDISGTIFRTGGEPLTPAKYAAIRKAGADAVNGWSLSEAGQLAGNCPDRQYPDESHVFTEKLAMIQRPVKLRGGSESVDALHLTTLLPATPKLMLNVELGDYGVLSRRRCGCALEEAGLTLHVHTIRSYEKITANGMHFLGTQLTAIVEEDLPRAFGGAPTDYQFVEEEDGTASRVTVVVSPRVGNVDEQLVITTVLTALGGHTRGEHMMAGNWRQSGVLRVARREPYSTPNSKTPAVRVIRSEQPVSGDMRGR
jgi:phenylacetate-coenzyme A ligase PaaK-like adenylate-forming protein